MTCGILVTSDGLGLKPQTSWQTRMSFIGPLANPVLLVPVKDVRAQHLQIAKVVPSLPEAASMLHPASILSRRIEMGLLTRALAPRLCATANRDSPAFAYCPRTGSRPRRAGRHYRDERTETCKARPCHAGVHFFRSAIAISSLASRCRTLLSPGANAADEGCSRS
jgi:hypothetical protein